MGSVSDIIGRRRTYVVGLGVFVVASLACGLAPSEGALVASRAMQGIGAAAMFATTIALINSSYSGRARGVAFGIWGATNGAAAAAGPIVGGLLTQRLSWRWVFIVNVPIGVVTIFVARRVLIETRPADRPRIDWAGGAAFTVAAAAATFSYARTRRAGRRWRRSGCSRCSRAGRSGRLGAGRVPHARAPRRSGGGVRDSGVNGRAPGPAATSGARTRFDTLAAWRRQRQQA